MDESCNDDITASTQKERSSVKEHVQDFSLSKELRD